MIGVDYVRRMAAYNRWQNENLYGAADGLTDEERHRERGADWISLRSRRREFDAGIVGWSEGTTANWLSGTHTHFSPSFGREITNPLWLLVSHFFNHQTHHRGQIHCMLTQAGQKPVDTDLPMMPG